MKQIGVLIGLGCFFILSIAMEQIGVLIGLGCFFILSIAIIHFYKLYKELKK